jgi:hypothetical protein
MSRIQPAFQHSVNVDIPDLGIGYVSVNSLICANFEEVYAKSSDGGYEEIDNSP